MSERPAAAALAPLLDRAAQGDAAAWEEVVDRFAPLVWAVCRRHRLAEHDARDVVATVWLRLVERLGSIRRPEALPGWIATTARNECVTALRRNARQRVTEVADLADATEDTGETRLLEEERRHALRTAFGELGERCARLLRLLFADPPVEYAEISTRLDMPVGSIGPTRARCLATLRRSPALAAYALGGSPS